MYQASGWRRQCTEVWISPSNQMHHHQLQITLKCKTHKIQNGKISFFLPLSNINVGSICIENGVAHWCFVKVDTLQHNSKSYHCIHFFEQSNLLWAFSFWALLVLFELNWLFLVLLSSLLGTFLAFFLQVAHWCFVKVDALQRCSKSYHCWINFTNTISPYQHHHINITKSTSPNQNHQIKITKLSIIVWSIYSDISLNQNKKIFVIEKNANV